MEPILQCASVLLALQEVRATEEIVSSIMVMHLAITFSDCLNFTMGTEYHIYRIESLVPFDFLFLGNFVFISIYLYVHVSQKMSTNL